MNTSTQEKMAPDNLPTEMSFVVSKTFDFPASHQVDHDKSGPCARLHGHTWVLTVFMTGRVVSDWMREDYGMVANFNDLKKLYREEIEPLTDHQHLNNTIPVSEHTTELIAAWILKTLRAKDERVFKVRLGEGLTSFVEVEVR